jgi:hypothetical protein
MVVKLLPISLWHSIGAYVDAYCWHINGDDGPTINLAPEWPPVNPKITFRVVDEHFLLCISPTKVSANDAKLIDVSLPMELVVWWVSKRIAY